MSQKLKVAVIGLGTIGTIVATNLVKGTRTVIVADRSNGKAIELSDELGNLVQPKDISSAIKEADILVLAILFEGIKEFLKTYAAELHGKIIVDPSNPIAVDEKGVFKKVIAEDQSAGEILSTLLPKNTRLAKALGTLSAASLSKAAFKEPERAVLFYATDDTTINTAIEEVIRDSGFEPVRVGNISQSARIEVFGQLSEYGGLGKTISLDEARQYIQPE